MKRFRLLTNPIHLFFWVFICLSNNTYGQINCQNLIPWTSYSTYSSGDYVKFNGVKYQSVLSGTNTNQNHTPPSTIGMNNGFWTSASPLGACTDVATACVSGPLWSNSTSYTTGAIVRYNGSLFIARGNNTGQTPGLTASLWNLYDDCSSYAAAVANTGWSLAGNTGTLGVNGYLGTTDGQPLLFKTAGSERMRVSETGNVGIGLTTNIHAPLQFSTTAANRKIVLTEGTGDNDHQFFGFGVNANLLRYQVNSSSDRHGFFAGINTVSSTELMSILGSGKVGIGTSSPQSLLSLGPDQSSNIKFAVFDNGTADRYGLGMNNSIFRFHLGHASGTRYGFFDSDAGTNELVSILGTGNVGIGITAPTRQLHVRGLQLQNTYATSSILVDGTSSGAPTNAGVEFGLNGTAKYHATYSELYGCLSAFKVGPVGTTNKSIYFPATNQIVFSNSNTFGVCGNAGLSGTYLFDSQVSSTSLLVATATSSPNPTLPAGYLFRTASNANIDGNLLLGTASGGVATSYKLEVNGQSYLKGKLEIDEATVSTASLKSPLNTTAGFSAGDTTTFSWVQTNQNKPLALNPVPGTSSYVAVGFRPNAYNVPAGYKLAVKGKIICEELKVMYAGQWADYVFAKNYKLRSLAEVANYISENKHLPDVPSEAEIKEKGIEAGQMDATLLRKIEELTLYMIEQNKKMEETNQRLNDNDKKIEELRQENASLKNQLNQSTK